MSAEIQKLVLHCKHLTAGCIPKFAENWLICRREEFAPIVLTTTGHGKGLMEFMSIECNQERR